MTHCPRCGKTNPAEIHTCTPPLALRLADALEATHPAVWPYGKEAAAELRRLHAELDKVKQITLNDEALLRQASAMLATMPVKHPQQGQERDALLEVIKERLK